MLEPTPARQNSLDVLVGASVRQIREERSLTEAECATALSVTAAEYADREAGKARFRAEELMALAKLLGVPIGRFYDDVTGRATTSA